MSSSYEIFRWRHVFEVDKIRAMKGLSFIGYYGEHGDILILACLSMDYNKPIEFTYEKKIYYNKNLKTPVLKKGK